MSIFATLPLCASETKKDAEVKAEQNARNTSDELALFKAASTGDLKAIEALVKKGVSVNARNFSGTENNATPLMYTADHSTFVHLECVNYLISQKADADLRNGDNQTALHAVAESAGNCAGDVAFALLNAKADVRAKNNKGEIALLIAVHKANSSVVSRLVFDAATTKDDIGQAITDLEENAVSSKPIDLDFSRTMNLLKRYLHAKESTRIAA